MSRAASPAPVTGVSPELKTLLRRLKLGKLLDTLPDRLALAASHHMPHHDFLELLCTDEVERRERQSAHLRARSAGLDPTMVLDSWDDTANVSYDRTLWAELTSLRFVTDHYNVFVLGPVGVGKTFLATALGHLACRRRINVVFLRAETLFHRLSVARLDNSYDDELRKLFRVELLVIDEFCHLPMDLRATTDFYELVVERHRTASTIITSNREPPEMLAMMSDPLLAQSAMDRLQSAAFELVIEGESYRPRQKPTISTLAHTEAPDIDVATGQRRRPTTKAR